MELIFRDIIDSHLGEEAFIIAHGPSLNNYIPKIPEFAKEGVLIGCNEWFPIYSTPPAYWVLSNNVMTIRTEIDTMNMLAGKTTIVYADTVDNTDKNWIYDNLKADYLPYDQRHKKGKPCNPEDKCCFHLNPYRLTIQEEVQKYTGYHEIFYGGDTVILHCLSLAILLGCNPINIIGIDLDYKKGYANNNCNLISKISYLDTFDDIRDRLILHLQILVNSAKNINRVVQTPHKNLLWGCLEYKEK